MKLTFVLLLLVILAGVSAVASGWGDTLSDPEPDRRPWRLPEGPIDEAAVARVTFTPALRGYRCDEVDQVLERLRTELTEKDARIADLERRRGLAPAEQVARTDARHAAPPRQEPSPMSLDQD